MLRQSRLMLILFVIALPSGRADDAPSADKAIAKLKRLGARVTLDDQKRVIGVNLGERRIADTDLAILKGLPHLQELDLTRTPTTSAGLVHLKELKSLRKLYLTDTRIDDAGLAQLKGLKSLELVGLSGTRIGDAGVEHLHELTRLKTLFCIGSKVTASGVERLHKAVPQCEVIQ